MKCEFDNEDIEFLLGRKVERTPPKDIAGKVFLVTGAGGTIGSQIVSDLLVYGARQVVLVENSEFALYTVSGTSTALVPRLTSYGSLEVRRLLDQFRVDCIIHAGAYKHVPLVELNPIAGVQNNVFEFECLIEYAEMVGTPEMMVISSDKAVNPTNVMGATKALVERLAINCKVPKVSAVRFGNVLGSSGSVLNLFAQQLREGRPLTITDEAVERYFMSIPEACGLVLNARSVEGSVKVLDMGTPVKIMDMASRFLELRGEPNHPYKVTGLRPGEKISEELCLGGLEPSDTERILVDKAPLQSVDLERLRRACHSFDFLEVRQCLKDLVPGYAPSCGVVDPLYIQQQSQALMGMEDCFRPPKEKV